MNKTIEECQKLAMEYGQLHEDECDLNAEDGSFDGCDCAMKQLVEEVATKAYEAGQVEGLEKAVMLIKDWGEDDYTVVSKINEAVATLKAKTDE